MWKKFLRSFRAKRDDIIDALAPLAGQIAKAGGNVLLEAAMLAVTTAEAAGGTGEEKFVAAKKIAVKTLQQKGIPIIMNAINGAIEAAVAAIKK